MEPLMPSEVARLVYGYLKEEKNEDTADCFLKTSPHLTECYQSFKANRKFNTKVNGFTLQGIFDIFGTMCTMSNVLVLIKERISENCESKTLLEKLQCLLDENHTSTNEGNDVNTETLERASNSTRSDPQIKNTLDEFLVFNVDNAENNENTCTNDQLNDSIKSRLRSARKKDDVPSNIKKNIFNIPKPIIYANEDCMKVDNNIVLIHDGNIETTVLENYDLLSNQIVLQSSDSYKFDPTRETIESGTKTEYVKIAPKMTPMSNTFQAPDRLIFPKRRKQSFEGPGIRSKFRRTNLIKQPLVQTPKPIIIEVPNQNSFENQEKNHIEINDVIRIQEVLSKTDDVTIVHDTPDDRLKPPKSKSMSTPRRRSAHIRCLDFSTPQPKNMTRNETRSKLFYGTPKRLEKCPEEPSPSPLPKLQADWGSVNGFESIIKKEMMKRKKHWDSDIREMVGAGILTSDADGRKTRKKKTPRKKIKNVQNNSINLLKDQDKSSNNSITTNELHTDVSNSTHNTYDVLTEQDSNRPLLDGQKPIKEQTKIPISLETPNNLTEFFNKQPPIKSDSLNTLNDQKSLKEFGEFPISLETPDKMTELYNEQAPTISGTLKTLNNINLLKKQNELLILLETPDKITELYNQQLPTTSNSLENTNNQKSLINKSEISMSLETPDKTTELYTEQLSIKPKPLKNNNDENLLKNQIEFLIPSETSSKITKLNYEQQLIKSNSSKSQCTSQINPEQSHNVNLKEQNINQNQLINSFSFKTISDVTNQEKDPNISKMFSNHNYSLTENNSNELTNHLKEQSLLDKKDINNSSELNSPIKCINTDPVKPKLFETPYKCDDAVDVPETPISKIIREYDPSKLITPLPCTPEHYDDSLTETPLTKIFRETSYLNRPPISPFPPTPGNSMSVDTLFIPQEQDCIKTSNNTSIKMNDSRELLTKPIQAKTTDNESSTKRKKEKAECTPINSKIKLSTKSKRKSIVEKKKQLYESVKIELFGSEISMSSQEFFDTNEQHKTKVINHKPLEEEKKSGFKPIPKRKSIENKSVINFNGIEKNLSNELNMQPTKAPIIKPIQRDDNNDDNTDKIKKTKTIKNSMVHFDGTEKKLISLSISPRLDKSNNKNTGKIQNKTTINNSSEQLVGLSRYLNKTTSKLFDSSPKGKNIKTIEPRVKTYKLNNSDSNINYSEMHNVDRSSKNISTGCISNNTITNDMNNQRISVTEKCKTDIKKVSNRKENNTVHNKSIEPLESVQTMSLDHNISNPNSISKNKINTSLDRSESSIINHNSNVNNTSCVTLTFDDTLDVHINKVCEPLNNMEYLKISKTFEVITEDGEHGMVYLIVSEKFTFLDIPSELNNVQPSDPITSPSITRKKTLEVTPEIESGEIVKDKEKLKRMTSTPKDVVIKNDKVNRARRSPSLWNDSIHNHPIKHRDDRPRETRHWQNKTYHKHGEKKYRKNSNRYHDDRPQFYSQNHHQRSHHKNWKREFCEVSEYDKYRNKHNDEKRRINRVCEGGNRTEENERYSTQKRISQNDSQMLNRSEDIVKKHSKRPADRTVYNKTPAKVSKVEHQMLLKNVNVDDFLSVVHGQSRK